MHKVRLPLIVATVAVAPLIAHVALAQGQDQPPAAEPPATEAPAQPTPPAPPGEQPPSAPAEGTEQPPAPTAPTATQPPAPPPPPTTAVPPEPPVEPQPAGVTEPEVPPPPEPPPPPPSTRPQSTLAPEILLGGSVRLGDTSAGYDVSRREGLLLGAGLLYAPTRRWAFGLQYLRDQAGTDELSPERFDVTSRVSRTFHSALATVRAYPVRSEDIGLYASLSVGATFETATANGSFVLGEPVARASTFNVDAGPEVGLALGAGIGFDADLSDNLAVLGSFNFLTHRLSSDPMSDTGNVAVPGAGSTSGLDLRLAFQYRFDLSGTSVPIEASVESASR